jgi:hypothetical protein
MTDTVSQDAERVRQWFKRQGRVEFTTREARDLLFKRSIPRSREQVETALRVLQDAGELYLHTPPRTGLKGKPPARRWRVLAQPASESDALARVLAVWRERAKDPAVPDPTEIRATLIALEVREPQSLAWPIPPGTDRRELMAEWIRQFAATQPTAPRT